MTRVGSALRCATVVLALPAVARAHEEAGQAAGFLAGCLHPVSGLDHLLAMVAVGLWGAVLGSPAIWLLPVAFPVAMAMAEPPPIITTPTTAMSAPPPSTRGGDGVVRGNPKRRASSSVIAAPHMARMPATTASRVPGVGCTSVGTNPAESSTGR